MKNALISRKIKNLERGDAGKAVNNRNKCDRSRNKWQRTESKSISGFYRK